jgi:NTP pyrophosphatase (non-canonical NTP hydrolase)
MNFRYLMDEEYEKVRRKQRKVASYHEGWGLLFEEVGEFFDEVKKKSSARDHKNALKELVQISALCQRIAEDLLGELL